MPDAEGAAKAPSLRRQTWVGLQGIGPVVVVGTVALGCLVVQLPKPFVDAAMIALFLSGFGVFVFLANRFGPEQAHR